MTRKAFILWGLVLINAYPLTIAVLAYLLISKTIALETMQAPAKLLPIAFFVTFGILFWKRLRAIGRPKLTYIWCVLFAIAAYAIGTLLVMAYLEIADFENTGLMPIVNSLMEGDKPTVWMNLKFALFMAPPIYLVNWGLFALLWFGSRDPQTPIKFNWLHRFKRTPKKNPNQPETILVNGTWLLRG